MNGPKISILVPCYNVEKYLRQCLDSVVSQTLRDIEIIVINDGSTDGTLDIIREYASRDDRIKIIDKPNEGYGKSMNRGLDMARGEYIGIVESDDWADPHMFEDLTRIADDYGVQIVKSDFYEYTTINGPRSVKHSICPRMDCGHVINPNIRSGIFWSRPSIWSAIYRRDFLNENGIRFLESPGASYQDTGFNFKVWAMASRAYLTDAAYMHYRCDNENSSVKSKGKIFCICDEWDEIELYLAKRPAKKRACARLVPHIKLENYFWNLNRLSDDARREFAARLHQEYSRQDMKNMAVSRARYDDKSWARLMYIIYPKSRWWRMQRHFWNVIRPIYKTRVVNDYKIYYLFSHFIVRRVKIPVIEIL